MEYAFLLTPRSIFLGLLRLYFCQLFYEISFFLVFHAKILVCPRKIYSAINYSLANLISSQHLLSNFELIELIYCHFENILKKICKKNLFLQSFARMDIVNLICAIHAD